MVGLLLITDAMAARPEPPALIRDIHLVDDGRFLEPYLPALRTSNDGRIALDTGGTTLSLYLFTPEKVNSPWHKSRPGAGRILSEQTPYNGGIRISPVPNRNFGMRALCESTNAFPSSGDDANPYTCGAGGNNDCYDLTHVSWIRAGDSDDLADLWGTPLTVEVQNPKTAEARIVDVRFGESVRGAQIPSPVFWEPVATSDGRLLVGRLGAQGEFTFFNEQTGQNHTGRYDMVYSLLEDGADACDVRQWKRFYPIAHAPYDPRMKGKYGIAAFALRSGEGEPIDAADNVKATYPWIDREGNNLFMTAVSSRLKEQGSDYPNRCLPNRDCIDNEANGRHKGNAVFGLWTQGRTVHFDNLLNNTDWGLPLDPDGHRLVTMYQQPDGTEVEVRVGSGGLFKAHDYPDLRGRTVNSAILDSVQSLFNHRNELKPKTPRDVVWLVGNGKSADELAFDDYLNPDGFIVSNMMASLSKGYPWHNDGSEGGFNINRDVHLQNAAGSVPERWNTPAYGLVRRGTGRAEPIALGGINGRGFWLDGGNEIVYGVDDQPSDPADSDWYTGLFVDARFGDDGARRNLIRYPDNSSLALEGRSTLLFLQGDQVLKSVTLPVAVAASGWTHIGLNLSDRNRNINLLLNGYPLQSFRLDDGFFNIGRGDLIVGGNNGFRGWIDDFKIFAQKVGAEVACNHAGGTMVGVDGNTRWNAIAGRYSQASHSAINALVAASGHRTFARYACYTDYRNADGIDVNNPPTGTVSMREAINFPEGPLVHNQPRPDSVDNQFCLSCHQPGAAGGMSLDALMLNAGVNAIDDPRRQPTQHLRMVHGNIPAGWLNGKVTESTQVGREGFKLDTVLMTGQRPDDPVEPPEVGFTSANVVIGEDAGVVTANIRLSRAVNETTSVYLATNVDSARPGSDFYGLSEQLVFAVGETEKQVSVTILDDTERELDEQFVMRLFNNDGLTVGQQVLTVTIEDNDDGSVPTVSIESISVSESNLMAEVSVTLSQAASTPVTVDVATQPDQAINNEDFYGLYDTITFAPGETKKQVRIIIINDDRRETEESFGVNLFAANGAGYGMRRGTVTITDDD